MNFHLIILKYIELIWICIVYMLVTHLGVMDGPHWPMGHHGSGGRRLRQWLRAAAGRWSTSWAAVRRSFNRAADHHAARGTFAAVDAHAAGDDAPRAWVWVSPDARGSVGHRIPWVDCPAALMDGPLCAGACRLD